MPDQMQLFELTEQEWRARSKQFAALYREYRLTEENKKSTVKAMNDLLKGLREEMNKLHEVVLQGREWRERGPWGVNQAGEILPSEDMVPADEAFVEDEEIRVTCQLCRGEFSSFAEYIDHRREAHRIGSPE